MRKMPAYYSLDRTSLNKQRSYRFGFGAAHFSPEYHIEVAADEEMLAKVPILLKLPNKQDRIFKVPISGLAELIRGTNTLIRTEKPYDPYVFDGVLFITHKRLIVHFIEMFAQHDLEVDVQKLHLSITNKHHLQKLTRYRRKKIDDIAGEPTLSINRGELEVVLLDGRGIHYNSGDYFIARYSTYMAVFEAVEYAKGKREIALKKILTKMYSPDFMMPEAKYAIFVLFPTCISILVTFGLLFIPAFIDINFSGEDRWLGYIFTVALIYAVVSSILIIAQAIFIHPGRARGFQQKLIDERSL